MNTIEIDWTQNCLTGGIHHGRDGAIWSIPLRYAAIIFTADTLKDIVISRIYADALQVVEHSNHEGHSEEWARRTKEIAEQRYKLTLEHKVGEIANYYKSSGWLSDQQEIAGRVVKGKLNPHYAPLHSHDSINLFCRILGDSSARMALN